MPQRGDIYWIKLDPTIGSEIKKTRPAVILSNNAQNQQEHHYVIAPITSKTEKLYPFEALLEVNEQRGKALLDQVRTVSHKRIGSWLGRISQKEMRGIERALKLVLSL